MMNVGSTSTLRSTWLSSRTDDRPLPGRKDIATETEPAEPLLSSSLAALATDTKRNESARLFVAGPPAMPYQGAPTTVKTFDALLEAAPAVPESPVYVLPPQQTMDALLDSIPFKGLDAEIKNRLDRLKGKNVVAQITEEKIAPLQKAAQIIVPESVFSLCRTIIEKESHSAKYEQMPEGSSQRADEDKKLYEANPGLREMTMLSGLIERKNRLSDSARAQTQSLTHITLTKFSKTYLKAVNFRLSSQSEDDYKTLAHQISGITQQAIYKEQENLKNLYYQHRPDDLYKNAITDLNRHLKDNDFFQDKEHAREVDKWVGKLALTPEKMVKACIDNIKSHLKTDHDEQQDHLKHTKNKEERKLIERNIQRIPSLYKRIQEIEDFAQIAAEKEISLDRITLHPSPYKSIHDQAHIIFPTSDDIKNRSQLIQSYQTQAKINAAIEEANQSSNSGQHALSPQDKIKNIDIQLKKSEQEKEYILFKIREHELEQEKEMLMTAKESLLTQIDAIENQVRTSRIETNDMHRDKPSSTSKAKTPSHRVASQEALLSS